MHRAVSAGLALASLLMLPALALGQDAPLPPPGTILTIVPDRLISDTQFGQAVQARLDAAAAALLAENRKIDAELEAEEVALTAQRDGLPAADFRELAEVFDAKVENIRSAQDAKGRVLTQTREQERQKLLQAVVPILAEIMAKKGAVAILDKSTVFLAFDSTDVTNEAIAQLDATLGDGDGGAAPIPDQNAPTVPGNVTPP